LTSFAESLFIFLPSYQQIEKLKSTAIFSLSIGKRFMLHTRPDGWPVVVVGIVVVVAAALVVASVVIVFHPFFHSFSL
jgi:hypothetical protein